MAIRKLYSLLLALALGLVLVAIVVRDSERGAGGVAAASWPSDDDDDEEDDSDDFDFLSNRLDAVEPAGNCEGQQCAAADGTTVTIESVLVRGLVTKKPKVQDITKEHFRFATNSQLKSFGGEALGYVTPWNNRGYDFAKLFRNKFTYISPVWLQIREDPKENKPVVAGTHDIDRQWIRDVRGDDGGPAIVPRVVYERNKLASTDVPLIIDELLALSEKHAFDGFVFEIPVVEGTMDLLLQMGEAFQEANKLLLLVLNRSTKGGKLPITHKMFQELLPVVHRFSMNAYDFQMPGPNAPSPWLRTTLDALTDAEKEKILLGIPFYGYDNSGTVGEEDVNNGAARVIKDAVTGPSYINTLTSQDVKKIRWDASAHECFSEYYAADGGDHHVVFYPCLQFLHDRLQLFEEYGVGAAIWELGQGLVFAGFCGTGGDGV